MDTSHLLQAIPEVRPLAQTDPEGVAALTQWLEVHTKPAGSGRASSAAPADNGHPRKRRVTVQEA